MHLGIRGPLYGAENLTDDAALGFQIITSGHFDSEGMSGILERVRARVGDRPVYVSIDIDVLDPAFAPGTGTPEAGGITSRELLTIIRGLAGLKIVGCDIVEVAPAYDHAQITGIAAAHVMYDLLSLMARSKF
jgi:agmatinase